MISGRRISSLPCLGDHQCAQSGFVRHIHYHNLDLAPPFLAATSRQFIGLSIILRREPQYLKMKGCY